MIWRNMENPKCPKCGRFMIKREGMHHLYCRRYGNKIYDMYPPQFPWPWWCGCGHAISAKSAARNESEADEQIARSEWEGLNDIGLDK